MKPRNKQLVTYLLIALGGLLVGWLIFGGRAAEESHSHAAETAGVTEYTCSMHPQIRQNEPGKCPICGMDLIPVTATGNKTAQASPYVLEMSAEAVALANIQTTPVQAADAASELMLTGTIQQNEKAVSSITAKFPGRIEQLYVNFTGQEVRKGERLASVYSPELVTAQRELQEAAKAKDIMPELYEAAKAKLRLWNLSSKQIQQIESTRKALTSFDIYADVSGVVTGRMVAVGDYVSTGSVLFEVSNLSSVWVVLDAYETDLSRVQEGAMVDFTVPAIPGQEYSAKVQFVTPVLDAGTRAVQVRAEVANPDRQLKPGMFVNARIKSSAKTAKATKGLAVPRTAVLWTGKRSVVYVKAIDHETPAFEMREVTLGPSLGDTYLIQSGLQEGEQVVTNGVFAVDGAAQLSGNYSMMSSPENKQMKVPAAFQEQLGALVTSYYTLKNALVASDATAAQKAAADLQQTLGQVDMSLLDGSTHAKWMELQPALAANTEQIQESSTLEKQRAAFSPLSDRLIEAVETFGTNKEVVYKQKCPMALGDKGAYWLSEQKDIRNPYFGEAMLSCGETEQTYRPNQTAPQAQPAPVQSHAH
ncbi:efflux RND transporter periplasmic adaptor subunit [Pontibacter mangrovi]|uniref:Efflux RND transporter periplasmic adaptor subunit n=1 Tax=Pontibacter mangrovi TaxID=2589816 RepID=A0A501W306_9BACT|nr:efflux RND transporter periplasmic adaptor subunit [Pontibacter mangrovi]TPE43015.1 efflux RND transporter periplasmic adaptor subunit [Pontibacter mangrovi]